MRRSIGPAFVFLALGTILTLLSLRFYDWPPNRDVTTYATIAQELIKGKELYVDVWDLKPPAIFVTYMLAQTLVSSKPLEILLLHVLPSIVVLGALLKSGREARFGSAAGIWSCLFWVALSGDLRLQMQDPSTEIYINACVALAFLQCLRLRRESTLLIPVSIGALFAIACLFKTVAAAMAVAIGLIHLACPPPGCRRSTAAGQVAVMAASGLVCMVGVAGYFAVTDRLQVFWETVVDAGVNYSGDMRQNVVDGLTLSPLVGDSAALKTAVAVVPWLSVALLAWLDQRRRRSWLLLGAYAFSALVSVGLPGNFYAHYFQLLVPPLCLGLGWLGTAFAEQPRRMTATATSALLGIGLAVLCAYEARTYRVPTEMLVRGTYQELYLETQKLGRRLGDALKSDEILYQWGEESGLYWFSGKRPPASILTWPLFSGPQAGRLTRQTQQSLMARPPDLIVAASRVLENSDGHPIFEWIQANYSLLQPERPGERKFFTFFVRTDASPELVQRILGVRQSAPAE